MQLLTTEEIVVDIDKKNILNSISITIERGKVYSIVGPNGSGKSTLLKTISRHLKYKKGKVCYAGEDIFQTSTKEFARLVAMLWQKNSAPQDLTVYDLIEYGRYPHRKFGRTANDAEIIEAVIDTVGLDEFRDKK